MSMYKDAIKWPYTDPEVCIEYADERNKCHKAAAFYFMVLWSWSEGEKWYKIRQLEYCLCCPK